MSRSGIAPSALAIATGRSPWPESFGNGSMPPVEVIGGKVGQFDVEIDGMLVVSRGRSFLARMRPALPPKTAEAIATVERHLASSE